MSNLFPQIATVRLERRHVKLCWRARKTKKKKKRKRSIEEARVKHLLIGWFDRCKGFLIATSYTERVLRDKRLTPARSVNRLRDNRARFDWRDIIGPWTRELSPQCSWWGLIDRILSSFRQSNYEFSEESTAIRGQYATRPILYRFSLLYERNERKERVLPRSRRVKYVLNA